jgi:hypothetical protein
MMYVGGDVWSWSVGGQENYENYKAPLRPKREDIRVRVG